MRKNENFHSRNQHSRLNHPTSKRQKVVKKDKHRKNLNMLMPNFSDTVRSRCKNYEDNRKM